MPMPSAPPLSPPSPLPPFSAAQQRLPDRTAARLSPPHAPCPFGCAAHGRCHRGRCTCDAGFFGRGCERVVPLCEANCSGHGACEPLTATATADDADDAVVIGVCRCHDGYFGAACAEVRPATCPLGCSAHGTCSRTGRCECHDGLAPPACAFSAGSRLAIIAAAVASLGQAPPSSALTSAPSTAPSTALTTALTTAHSTPAAPCPLGCSGRGHCRGAARRCECLPGFGGPGCELAVPRCPADCNGHGQCVEGFCECDATWTGAECAQPAYVCEGGCNGHGSCVGVGFAQRTVEVVEAATSGAWLARGREGRCVCDTGYEGDRCEFFLLPPPACLHNCSGRGTCHTRTGTCECVAGFTGAGCEEEDSSSAAFCPRHCCGRGRCKFRGGMSHAPLLTPQAKAALGRDGRSPPTPYCQCEAGWGGDDCCRSVFADTCPDACSGHGTCADGVCSCWSGWEGESCAKVHLEACGPRGCSGHGTCLHSACRCEPGFSGDACELGDAFE